MPSSWTQNFYHLVFSTKHREPFISEELETRLHPFLGGIVRDHRCTPIAINGMADHVHLLVRYRSDLSHSDLVRHAKFRSTNWVRAEFSELKRFAWQEGGGGFTVSKSLVARVESYIQNQKEHHRTLTFKEEFLELLRLHGVEFDEAEVFPEG